MIKTLYKDAYIENAAVDQINVTLKKYPQILKAIAMPDLHPGPGIPIGCSFVSENCCFPKLIGSDIGCGMTLFKVVNSNIQKFSGKKVNRKLSNFNLKVPYEYAISEGDENRKLIRI